MANNSTTLPVAAGRPQTSFQEIEKLAEAVARSRMFGIQTKEQALVLMSISQAEGRHPALAARDYDIISGRPAKKAEAMMRDFLDSGGKVEWHALDDGIADATFAHPAGGKIRILWDTARATKAGLAGKEMYKKFPRQMLRSRCVSEGVRTVCPMATSGFYVPEEVRDMPAILPAASASDATSDLDQFAAGTGEVEDFPARDIFAEAHAAAKRGTTAFREFWRSGLLPDERDVLRPGLDGYQKIAAAAVNPFDPKPAGGSFPLGQQGAPDPATAPAARAEPDRGARRARQQQATPAPAPEAPAEEQAPHAPLAGAADDDPFGLAEVDHHMPAEPPPPQPSGLEIAVPLKNGKRDWCTWVVALFAPKVWRCGASNELADLLGANGHNLEEARAALAPADRAEMERIIAEQWQKLPA